METAGGIIASGGKLERIDDRVIVRLPAFVSLHEAQCAEFMCELRVFAEDLHRHGRQGLSGVLVYQIGDADDRTKGWHSALESQLMLHDLAERLDLFRWLLSLIRNSEVPWIYAAANDCFGSFWEIASACHRRYWLKTSARVGLPEIAAGGFPPGGTLESLAKRFGKVMDRWQARPVETARQAAVEGLIDFCSDADPWQDMALRLFDDLVRRGNAVPGRAIERKNRRQPYDFDQDLRARHDAIERLEASWKEEPGRSTKQPSAWDYGWQLFKDKDAFRDSHERGRLVAFVAARHYLSSVFRAWVAEGVARYSIASTPPPDFALIAPYVIDLNFCPPPSECLVRLITGERRLIFVADDAKILSTHLNQSYARLAKALGEPRAAAAWDALVTWRVGVAHEADELVLRWGVDDRFYVRHGSHRLSFVRLQGNDTDADAGVIEWIDGESTHGFELEIDAALATASAMLPSTTVGQQALPLSAYARSVLLEELVRLAGLTGGDLSDITKAMRDYGWRFAGDENAWDRFLRGRCEGYVYDTSLLTPLDRAFQRSLWEVSSWRELRIVAKKQTIEHHGQLLFSPSPAVASHRCALIAGAVVARGWNQRLLSSQSLADVGCARSLGFPHRLGTPLAFVRTLGSRRFAFDLARHWPEGKLRVNFADLEQETFE